MMEVVTGVRQFKDTGRSETEDRWPLEAEIGRKTYYYKKKSVGGMSLSNITNLEHCKLL